MLVELNFDAWHWYENRNLTTILHPNASLDIGHLFPLLLDIFARIIQSKRPTAKKTHCSTQEFWLFATTSTWDGWLRDSGRATCLPVWIRHLNSSLGIALGAIWQGNSATYCSCPNGREDLWEEMAKFRDTELCHLLADAFLGAMRWADLYPTTYHPKIRYRQRFCKGTIFLTNLKQKHLRHGAEKRKGQGWPEFQLFFFLPSKKFQEWHLNCLSFQHSSKEMACKCKKFKSSKRPKSSKYSRVSPGIFVCFFVAKKSSHSSMVISVKTRDHSKTLAHILCHQHVLAGKGETNGAGQTKVAATVQF